MQLCARQQHCYDSFMAATRGIPANRVAAAVRDVTGIIWSKSKSDMAREYARAMVPDGVVVFRSMNKIRLPALIQQINQRFQSSYEVPKP